MAPRPHLDFVTIQAADDNDETQQEEEQHQPRQRRQRHLVLVGGGHAHVQVIKALSARPASLRVTLIDEQDAASYSGMVPGCVSKLYTHDDTRLYLRPLAAWAGIEFVQDKVVDIDLDHKLIHLRDRPDDDPMAFDVISMDIGSASRDLDKIPGARQFTIPTRPISNLVRRMERAETQLVPSQPTRVVVVGGGVAGIELAMSIHGRWSGLFCPPHNDNLHVTILDAACHSELLRGETKSCRRKLMEILTTKKIQIRYECGVDQIEKDRVVLCSGETIAFDHCIWATGAGAHDLAWKLASKCSSSGQRGGLKVDQHGWIEVNEHLQSVSHPFLFAAGDCASHPSRPPKAGVYAVRSGPILIQNLTEYAFHTTAHNSATATDTTAATGDAGTIRTTTTTTFTPRAVFRPQSDFLKLLACGDGTALGFRFGIPIHGKWVFQIKDSIDQAFMGLFQVENLPTRPEDKAKLYDISQYDAAYACKDHANPLDPSKAAALLWRSDDEVDFQQAFKVLRDMVCMSEYREQVLKHWFETERVVYETGCSECS